MRQVTYKIKWILFGGFIACLLIFNKVMIHIISFKKLVGYYGNKLEPLADLGEIDFSLAPIVRRGIHAVVRRLPWTPKCFEQSLTVLVLARAFRMPGVVFFGIKKDESGQMLAHAWSKLGEEFITGYQNKDEYTKVYQVTYTPKKIRKKG